jgi:hypothetical protein
MPVQLLLILFLLTAVHSLMGQTLEDGFKDPPVTARPKGYWVFVNGNFDLSVMTAELEEFHKKGMGGVDIWDVAGWVDPDSVVPAGPRFLGRESLQAIGHGIRQGKRLGLEMGLTISSSWNAGGDWVKADDGVKGLFSSEVSVTGPVYFRDSLPFPEIPVTYNGDKQMLLENADDGLPTHYEEVAILAIRTDQDTSQVELKNVINISDYFREGNLQWEVPEGEWKLVRYVSTGTGQPLMVPSPNSNGRMIDHFSEEAMKNNLNYIFDKLENELGDLEQSGLSYLYTDSYEANSSGWTSNLPQIFMEKTGYSILPYLPALDGWIVESEEVTSRFLHDFRKVKSDLIIENHYALGKKLSNERGMGFVAEAGGPGPPVHNTPFESLKALGSLTIPRGEFWYDPHMDQNHLEELQIVKGPASAAHLYDQPWVSAEAFTGTMLWQFGPGDLKPAADRALCEGLTRFIYHTTPHVPAEAGVPGWVYNFGTLINTTRIWWPKSAPFHNYLARSSFLLQQGNFVGDVLFYYGDDAPNFVNPKMAEDLLGFGYDYDFVNTDILLNKLEIKDGQFVLPHGQSYRLLVLPDDRKMEPEVLARLEKLIKAGGNVYGDAPLKSYGLAEYERKDQWVKEKSSEMWGKKDTKVLGEGKIYIRKKSLPAILSTMGISPDLTVSLKNAQEKLDYIHRQTDSAEIYFMSNRSDSAVYFESSFRVQELTPQFWNPQTGDIADVPMWTQQGNRTIVPVTLPGHGSIFVVFQRQIDPKPVSAVYLGKQKIFPSASGAGSITKRKDQFVFHSSGKYVFQYSNGSDRIFDITEEPHEVILKGEWEVRFPFGWGAPGRTRFPELISWTDSPDSTIRYFSGIVSYHKTFDMTAELSDGNYQVLIDLGEVSKVAEVFLNGKPIGISWVKPYILDVTEAIQTGTNDLVVEVANVMTNRLIRDARLPEGVPRSTHTNITKGPNAWNTPHSELEPVKSGLLGPVKIKFIPMGE